MVFIFFLNLVSPVVCDIECTRIQTDPEKDPKKNPPKEKIKSRRGDWCRGTLRPSRRPSVCQLLERQFCKARVDNKMLSVDVNINARQ